MVWWRARWARLDRADRRVAVPAMVLETIAVVAGFAHGPGWLTGAAGAIGTVLMVVWSAHALWQMRRWRRIAERISADLDAGRVPRGPRPPK